MKGYKEMKPSVFRDIPDIEYFDFEEDFIENSIRCIPMIVRFKMDKAGIKLKLAEWSRFGVMDRVQLATMECNNEENVSAYNAFLAGLIIQYTGKLATSMDVDPQPEWQKLNEIPEGLAERLAHNNLALTVSQWQSLSNLQRFALIKLCKQGHESKNFSKAMKEFGLLPTPSPQDI